MTHLPQTFPRLFSRSTVSLLLIVTITFNATAQSSDAKTRTVTLKQGHVLEMKLAKRLDSGRNKVGDDVVLRLTKPLMAEGVTVLPARWVVHGRVTEVKRAARNCEAGTLRWELDSVTTADGNKIEITSIGADTAREGLLKEAEQNATASSSGKKPVPTTGSSIGSTTLDLVLLPVGIFFLYASLLGEIKYGEGETCHGHSKGVEESIPKKSIFYGEISKDVSVVSAVPLK
jgi:hypothetical protein